MIEALSFFYGINLIALVYFTTFITVKGIFGSSAVSIFMIFILFAKYFIYWQILSVGISLLHLNTQWMIVGFVAGLYLSLPVFCYLNKKTSDRID